MMKKIPSLKRKAQNSLKQGKNRKQTAFYKRAFFFSSGKSKGSMALEGSLVLPLFLFFMMTVLLSLEVVRFQSDVQEALHEAGNKNAVMEYQVKYAGETKPNAEGQIKEYLGKQLYPYLCVAGGEGGVKIEDHSGNENGRIELTVEYQIKPFIPSLPIGEITFRDRFVSHAWIGYTKGEQQNDSEQEIYVYVTETGSKYHLSYECTYLRVQVQTVEYGQISSLRNQSGGKYYACQKCKPPKGGIVYITADGNSYHGRSNCSALKRTVSMMPLSEAKEEGYDACSKCAG